MKNPFREQRRESGCASSVSDQVYSHVLFDSLTAGGESRSLTDPDRLERVSFKNCTTSPGTCTFYGGCELRDVLFENFDCGDALRIYSPVALDRVVVRGERMPKSLQVRVRDGQGAVVAQHSDSWALDVREYVGELIVEALPPHSVLWNPEKHTMLDTQPLAGIAWGKNGFSRASYWRVVVSGAWKRGFRYCLVDTPTEGDFQYEQSLDEIELIAGLGGRVMPL